MKFNHKLDYYEFSWDGDSTITRINTLKGEKVFTPLHSSNQSI